MLSYRELKEVLSADMSRWKPYGWGGAFCLCSRFVIVFRLCSYFKDRKGLFRILYAIMWIIYKHYQVKTGIQLPVGTSVGKGVFFPHWSCIIINGDAQIGKWCNIYHGVTIGRSSDGQVPMIGDHCTIYAGAIIIGGVTIGNGVTIGANSVVTKDIPDGEVWAGIPAKKINK